MGKKLRSVLRIPRLRLALKAVLLALAAQFLPAWIFVLLAVLAYFSDAGIHFFFSYLFLIIAGLFAVSHLSSFVFVPFFALAAAAFFGVKEMIFVSRGRIHFVFLILCLSFYFYGALSGLIGLFPLAVAVFFVFRDFMAGLSGSRPSTLNLFALAAALILAELSWLHLWLPLPIFSGVLNLVALSAGLAFLFDRYLSDQLSNRIVLFVITACAAVLLLTPLFVFLGI
jgi:hypothetical protein